MINVTPEAKIIVEEIDKILKQHLPLDIEPDEAMNNLGRQVSLLLSGAAVKTNMVGCYDLEDFIEMATTAWNDAAKKMEKN